MGSDDSAAGSLGRGGGGLGSDPNILPNLLPPPPPPPPSSPMPPSPGVVNSTHQFAQVKDQKSSLKDQKGSLKDQKGSLKDQKGSLSTERATRHRQHVISNTS
jgi:hypothetical protein